MLNFDADEVNKNGAGQAQSGSKAGKKGRFKIFSSFNIRHTNGVLSKPQSPHDGGGRMSAELDKWRGSGPGSRNQWYVPAVNSSEAGKHTTLHNNLHNTMPRPRDTPDSKAFIRENCSLEERRALDNEGGSQQQMMNRSEYGLSSKNPLNKDGAAMEDDFHSIVPNSEEDG